MNVKILPSARLRNARINLAAMVADAEAIEGFTESPFESAIWVTSPKKRGRASSASVNSNRLYFTKPMVGNRSANGRVELEKPMASFIKAVIKLRENDNPRNLNDHVELIRAGGFLHDVSKEIGYDPARLLPDHFHSAAIASRKQNAKSTAYNIGKKLVEIAGWINQYNLAKVRIDFANPNKRPNDHTLRMGPEAESRRVSKLPSVAALDALPQIANCVTEEIDVLRVRVVKLLACGGWRINELLSTAANCEVEEPAIRQGKSALDVGSNPIVRYGIRYFAEKVGAPRIKWIPTEMVSVARRAITDIRRITQPVRDDLIWMKRYQDRINAAGLDGNPNTIITLKELDGVLGLRPKGSLNWCLTWQVPRIKLGLKHGVRSGDVVAAIRRRWPEVPGEIGLELEEYMFLTPRNATHAERATIPGSVRFLTDGMMAHFLCGHGGVPSIFERFGFTEPDGKPIRVTTHQFRHWLNTLAQEGGMSQMEIARWSGRKDVAQNDFYDHVSGMQLAGKTRDLIAAGSIVGPIATACSRLPPAERKKFLQAQIATGHRTDLGLCVHDWSLTPCPIHGDCSNCNDIIVVKGNEEQLRNTRTLFDENDIPSGQGNAGDRGGNVWSGSVGSGAPKNPRWTSPHHCRP